MFDPLSMNRKNRTSIKGRTTIQSKGLNSPFLYKGDARSSLCIAQLYFWAPATAHQHKYLGDLPQKLRQIRRKYLKNKKLPMLEFGLCSPFSSRLN